MSAVLHDEGDGDMDELLRQLPVPVAIVDPGRCRLTALNASFADLLEIDVRTAPGMDLVDLVPVARRSRFERVMEDLSRGLFDCCHLQGRVRTLRGDEVGVEMWIGSFNVAPPVDRAVVALVPSPHPHPSLEPWLLRPDRHHVVLGTVGLDLRFTELSASPPGVFGGEAHDLLGRSLADAVHPADAANLMLTVGRSAAERSAATVRVRMRHPEGWVGVRCTISPGGDGVARFYVALTILPSVDEVEPAADRLRRLESHLSRIASEVHAAGIGASAPDMVLTEAARHGLTARQSDILQRVVVGVAGGATSSDIARTLFISESTMRNHLAAVYRKFGVRSKAQLLAHLAARGTSVAEGAAPLGP